MGPFRDDTGRCVCPEGGQSASVQESEDSLCNSRLCLGLSQRWGLSTLWFVYTAGCLLVFISLS